jgi:hypothetical protein
MVLCSGLQTMVPKAVCVLIAIYRAYIVTMCSLFGTVRVIKGLWSGC